MGDSWIHGASDASTGGLLALRADLGAHVEEFEQHARASIGERLRCLMELRGAQLLRDTETLAAADPALAKQAANWHDDPTLTEAERTALEVCETFLIDHHSMTDEQIVRLQSLFGDQGAVAVLMNISMIDGFTKFRRVFTEGAF